MDEQHVEAVALHRWAVIAEAVSDRLEPAERGVLVRSIATRAHTHPDGSASPLQSGHPRPLDPRLAPRWPRGSAPRDAL